MKGNRRTSGLLLCLVLGLLASCQNQQPPLIAKEEVKATGTAPIVSNLGPKGDASVTLKVEAPQFDKTSGLQKGLKTQFQDLAGAVFINSEYWGVGISSVSNYNDWKNAAQSYFGTPNATTGIRQASLTFTNVLAGKRRIFKVTFYKSGWGELTNHQLLGVGDITPNASTPDVIDVTERTTITARIFQRLLRDNAAKGMLVPIADVQAYVNKIMKWDDNDDNVPSTKDNDLFYTWLKDDAIDVIASSIANNDWTVPTTIPPYLATLTSAHRVFPGTVTVKVVDIMDNPVSDRIIVWMNDLSSQAVDVTDGTGIATIPNVSVSAPQERYINSAEFTSRKINVSIPSKNKTFSATVPLSENQTIVRTLTPPTTVSVNHLAGLSPVDDPGYIAFAPEYVTADLNRIGYIWRDGLALLNETVNGHASRTLYFIEGESPLYQWNPADSTHVSRNINFRVRKMYFDNTRYIGVTIAGTGSTAHTGIPVDPAAPADAKSFALPKAGTLIADGSDSTATLYMSIRSGLYKLVRDGSGEYSSTGTKIVKIPNVTLAYGSYPSQQSNFQIDPVTKIIYYRDSANVIRAVNPDGSPVMIDGTRPWAYKSGGSARDQSEVTGNIMRFARVNGQPTIYNMSKQCYYSCYNLLYKADLATPPTADQLTAGGYEHDIAWGYSSGSGGTLQFPYGQYVGYNTPVNWVSLWHGLDSHGDYFPDSRGNVFFVTDGSWGYSRLSRLRHPEPGQPDNGDYYFAEPVSSDYLPIGRVYKQQDGSIIVVDTRATNGYAAYGYGGFGELTF